MLPTLAAWQHVLHGARFSRTTTMNPTSPTAPLPPGTQLKGNRLFYNVVALAIHDRLF